MVKRIGLTLFSVGLVLLTFVALALAAEAEGGAAGTSGDARMWIVISALFGMAIATTAGAISQARGLSAALEGIARNPSAAGQMMTPMIIGLALIESLVIYTFVIAFMFYLKF